MNRIMYLVIYIVQANYQKKKTVELYRRLASNNGTYYIYVTASLKLVYRYRCT